MTEEYRQHIVKMVEEINDLETLERIYTYTHCSYLRQTEQGQKEEKSL